MPKLLVERKQPRCKGVRNAICNLCDLLNENGFTSAFRLACFANPATEKPGTPEIIKPPKLTHIPERPKLCVTPQRANYPKTSFFTQRPNYPKIAFFTRCHKNRHA